MREVVKSARTARESLTTALEALQSEHVPEALGTATEPVARAMSALHEIEMSGGAQGGTAGPMALDALRRALQLLQVDADMRTAAGPVIAVVAGCLGAVHELNRKIQGSRSLAPPASAAGAKQSSPSPALPASITRDMAPVAAEPGRHTPYGAKHDRSTASKAGMAHSGQPAATTLPTRPSPARPASRGAERHHHEENRGGATGPAPRLRRIEAELGAQSSSNFYKGLLGDDVVESGGVFVATYQPPQLGEEVILHVSLPGGYEFEATALIAWTRTAGDASSYAPPGFGARFKQIAPEGRHLVQRYVRNREPLFHDDV